MVARDPRVRTRLLAGVLLAFFVVGGLGRLALGGALTAWDERILERVAALRTDTITGWMGVLSAIGAGAIAIPSGILVTWLLHRRGDRQAARCYLVTVLSGWALNLLLKQAFGRPRPAVLPHLDGAGGYSYPSGHAMLAPLVFGLGGLLLARHAPRWIAALATGAGLALALAIAVSRVYLAVHYPSDVVGALLAGTGWAALGLAVYGPLDGEPAAPPSRRWARRPADPLAPTGARRTRRSRSDELGALGLRSLPRPGVTRFITCTARRHPRPNRLDL